MSSFPEVGRSVSRSRAGFTLAELLVTLAVSGIVATLVLTTLSQQDRMARRQGSSEEAQQNARAAIELLASELRSIPREGLIHAGTNRIILRVPSVTGLLCTATVPDAGTIHVLVPARTWSRTTPDTLSLATQFSPVSASVDTTAFVPNFTTMNSVQVVTSSSIVAPCTTLRPGGDLRMLALTPVQSSTKYSADMQTAVSGGEVYLFSLVEYTVGASTVPGQWINRTTRGSTRPLAGPLPTTGTPGLRFRYFAGDTEITTLPVTDPETLDDITHVGIEVITVGGRTATQSRGVSTQVYLRNSGGS
jgi:prepilin-type N-terminal cleavage/methylation domain-containing protein